MSLPEIQPGGVVSGVLLVCVRTSGSGFNTRYSNVKSIPRNGRCSAPDSSLRSTKERTACGSTGLAPTGVQGSSTSVPKRPMIRMARWCYEPARSRSAHASPDRFAQPVTYPRSATMRLHGHVRITRCATHPSLQSGSRKPIGLSLPCHTIRCRSVAPRTGARIETSTGISPSRRGFACRPPHGGAD